MERFKDRKKQKGMSLIEILPIVIVITTLFSFLLGVWGIAHKHTLSSIAARTYTFDTLNNRANYVYFNDVRAVTNSYEQTESRYHATGFGNPDFSAPVVPVRYIAEKGAVRTGAASLHRQGIWQDGLAERNVEMQASSFSEINHVWVTVGYGICINANCGEGN